MLDIFRLCLWICSNNSGYIDTSTKLNKSLEIVTIPAELIWNVSPVSSMLFFVCFLKLLSYIFILQCNCINKAKASSCIHWFTNSFSLHVIGKPGTIPDTVLHIFNIMNHLQIFARIFVSQSGIYLIIQRAYLLSDTYLSFVSHWDYLWRLLCFVHFYQNYHISKTYEN